MVFLTGGLTSGSLEDSRSILILWVADERAKARSVPEVRFRLEPWSRDCLGVEAVGVGLDVELGLVSGSESELESDAGGEVGRRLIGRSCP